MKPELMSMRHNKPLQPTDHFVSAQLCLFKLCAGRTLAQSSMAFSGSCSSLLQGPVLGARTGELVAGIPAVGVGGVSQVCSEGSRAWGENYSSQCFCKWHLQAPFRGTLRLTEVEALAQYHRAS